jgi:hypothetical protein
MSQFLIYGLRDPRTSEIRYVGQSSTGLYRPSRHREKHAIAATTPHKRRWLEKLKRDGLRYEVVVLQQCEAREELNPAEDFWIALGFASLGSRFLNATAGARGANLNPVKYDAKMRAEHSAIMGAPEMRARISATKLDAQSDEQLLRGIYERLHAEAYKQWLVLVPRREGGRRACCTGCGETNPNELYATAALCRSCTRATKPHVRMNACGYCGGLGHNKRKCLNTQVVA